MSLVQDLRLLGREYEPDEHRYWVDRITPQLPERPLSRAELDEIFEGVGVKDAAMILPFLAEVGRKEVADDAIRYAGMTDNGFYRMELAYAAARCGDKRGYQLLEELFDYSMDADPYDKRAVPTDWIIAETLGDRLKTFTSAKLRLKLVRKHNARHPYRPKA